MFVEKISNHIFIRVMKGKGRVLFSTEFLTPAILHRHLNVELFRHSRILAYLVYGSLIKLSGMGNH